MKKILTAVVVAGSFAGLNAFACGGMTQIDPPSLTLSSGSDDTPNESVLTYLAEAIVVC
jgi:hypothetical protein